MARTTLNIDDQLMKRLKAEAARQGRTISELVEEALRLLLQKKKSPKVGLPPIPTFDGGRPFVNVADRDALYQAMTGR